MTDGRPHGVRTAVLQMGAARIVSLLAAAGALLILARLLPPSVFGVFAIIAAVVALLEEACAFGLRHYLVREKNLADGSYAQAAGLCAALCVLVTLVVAAGLFAAAPLLTVTQRDAGLLALLALAALPLALPIEAALQREMRFGLLASASALRAALEAGIAIILALTGAGLLALVVGLVAGRAGGTLLLLAAGRRLAVLPSLAGWRRFGRFGGQVTTASLLPQIVTVLTDVTVAGALGAATLGLFDRARRIAGLLDQVVMEGLKPIALPAITRALADGMPRARLYGLKVEILAGLCWPVFAGIAVFSEPLVRVMLGEQWMAAVPALRILALSGLLLPFMRMAMKFFIAIGAEATYLRIQATAQAVQAALIVIAAFVSLEAVCVAVLLGRFAKASLLTRALDLPKRHLLGPMARSAGAAAATVAGGMACVALFPTPSPAAELAAAITGCALGAGLGLLLTGHALTAFALRARTGRSLLARGVPS